jgi:antitoxin ParD1/3/4
MNVSLTRHFDDFVKNQVTSGRYHSASEVIRDALRLLEEREARYDRLQLELQQGLDSGDPRPLDAESIKRRGRRRLAAADP